MASLSAFIKTFLGYLSDATFLGSIEYINFRTRFVSVRKGYWNFFFHSIKSGFTHLENISNLIVLMKKLWFERLNTVTPSALHKYFMDKVKSSFTDFQNIYTYIYFGEPKIHKSQKFKRLRNLRYYEQKAERYQRYLSNEKEPDSFDIQFDDPPEYDTTVDNNISNYINSSFEDEQVLSDSSEVNDDLILDDFSDCQLTEDEIIEMNLDQSEIDFINNMGWSIGLYIFERKNAIALNKELFPGFYDLYGIYFQQNNERHIAETEKRNELIEEHNRNLILSGGPSFNPFTASLPRAPPAYPVEQTETRVFTDYDYSLNTRENHIVTDRVIYNTDGRRVLSTTTEVETEIFHQGRWI